jgi:acyl carrier protein
MPREAVVPVEASHIEAKVRTYLLENLMFSSDGAQLANDASLLEQGIIDSTGILEIIMFLETDFGVIVKDSDMLPENFDSVNNIVRFVLRLKTPQ